MLGMKVSAGHGLSGPIYRKEQVPLTFQEHFIIRGYRSPSSSFTQCLLSLFDPTNETLNFWTHFLPSLYFVWMIVQLSSTMDFINDSYTWPLICFLLTSIAFPLASAVAHLFNVMSETTRHVCFFLDYAALTLFATGCAVVIRAYSFPAFLLPHHEINQTLYYSNNDLNDFKTNFIFNLKVFYSIHFVTVSMCLCALSTAISCNTRFMKPSIVQKLMRLGSFSLPYTFDTVPLILRLYFGNNGVYFDSKDSDFVKNHPHLEPRVLSADYFHTRQFMFTILSAFIYASHLPERVLPGTFDIIGHSHQLFHIAAILGVVDLVKGSLLDMQERKEFLIADDEYFSNCHQSVGIITVTFFVNLMVVLFFVRKIYMYKNKNERNQKSD